MKRWFIVDWLTVLAFVIILLALTLPSGFFE